MSRCVRRRQAGVHALVDALRLRREGARELAIVVHPPAEDLPRRSERDAVRVPGREAQTSE